MLYSKGTVTAESNLMGRIKSSLPIPKCDGTLAGGRVTGYIGLRRGWLGVSKRPF